MSSLFDFESDSSGAEELSPNQRAMAFRDDASDDATTFTVASVLEKRDSSRRDTITRVMPSMSISDGDKYGIPTTAQKEQVEQHERTELRATSSLLNDSSDSEHDGDGGEEVDKVAYAHQHQPGVEAIFRAPSYESKHTNLLDEEVNGDDELGVSPKRTKRSNRHSDVFLSVYDDIATQKRMSLGVQAKEHKQEASHAATKGTAKGTQVKAMVTTALQTVKEGLAAHTTTSNAGCDGVVGSWDVDKLGQLSGQKRAFGAGAVGEKDDGQRNRRRSMNIRSELILLQDAVEEKKEECETLKQKLEESQSQVQALQRENAIVVQSKNVLESKLDLSKESCLVAEAKVATARAEAEYANNRVLSLSAKLEESQSETDPLRLDLETECRRNNEAAGAADQIESQLEKIKQEKKAVERALGSLKSRAEMQKELSTMRKALIDIKELESARAKETQRLEAELESARYALEKTGAAAAASESAMASLRDAVDSLEKENGSLRAQLTQNETPERQQWKMDVEPGSTGIEVAVKEERMDAAATPEATNIHNINELGAEEQSDGICDIPLTAIQGTPDSSSRQLSFTSSLKVFPTDEKENRQNASETQCPTDEKERRRQMACSLCMQAPRPNGAIKRCQCGRDDCVKWAHAQCVVNSKSVSKSVSHPGTPGPPMPTILCGGIWDE